MYIVTHEPKGCCKTRRCAAAAAVKQKTGAQSRWNAHEEDDETNEPKTLPIQLPVGKSSRTRTVVEQLLNTVGSAYDVEQYLKLYSKVDRQQFAVIKVGGEVIQNDLSTISYALTFLQDVGLFPIVVHGAGPQMNQLLDEQGKEPRYINGSRVTDETTLAIARRVFLDTNLALVDNLSTLGTRARPIFGGVFEVGLLPPIR